MTIYASESSSFSAVSATAHCAIEIRRVWADGCSHILKLARVVLSARERLPRGEWSHLWLDGNMPFSKRKAEMLVTIGRRLSWTTAQTFAHLPQGWSILYCLCRLERAATRMTTTKQYDLLNRLSSISSSGSQLSTPISFNYVYNDANQRAQCLLADGSFWVYQYDSLGQVKSGKKYWSDWTPVAGQQFEYGFDDIGNRRSTKAGGDSAGQGLRSASYSANNLNQYTSRDVPGAFDVLGVALSSETVTVNTASVYRRGEYFRKEITAANTSVPVWQSVAVAATGETTVNGNVFVPKTTEQFSYDLDGNLTGDGRWNYTWDAENRLIKIAANTSVGPQNSLQFEYDSKSRRIRKQVWSNTSWSGGSTNDLRFLYDGWNLIAIVNSSSSVLQSFLWGTDLSGSPQGAGGVGGLLAVIDSSQGTHFAAFDGNGNVSAFVKTTDGTVSGRYEYGPFAEVLRGTSVMAKVNPLRFSTKYQDDEADLLYYGYRYYNASTGRWLSRDPAEEDKGKTAYCLVANSPVNGTDTLGLWKTFGHHQTVLDWLKQKLGDSYSSYKWHCCTIDIAYYINSGSDEVDGVWGEGGWQIDVNWCEAQSSAASYQHAMRNGAAAQSVAQAADQYNVFIAENLVKAVTDAGLARNRPHDNSGWDCALLELALRSLGRSYHAFSDSLSPAHTGFQPWWGPIDGSMSFGWPAYLAFVKIHGEKEGDDVY